MDTRRFENLARRVIEELPAAFLDRAENVVVVVEDWATPAQLIAARADKKEGLLSLWEGIPLPPKITLFRRAIESVCATDDDIVADIVAEILVMAHYFGIDDDALHEMGTC